MHILSTFYGDYFTMSYKLQASMACLVWLCPDIRNRSSTIEFQLISFLVFYISYASNVSITTFVLQILTRFHYKTVYKSLGDIYLIIILVGLTSCSGRGEGKESGVYVAWVRRSTKTCCTADQGVLSNMLQGGPLGGGVRWFNPPPIGKQKNNH